MTESYTFPRLEDLLTSPLWSVHQHTPRVIYAEKETDHSVFTLEDLSVLEKILLWGRKKFLTPNSSVVCLKQQIFVLQPTVPLRLKEGPVIKTTSMRFELIKALSRKPTNDSSACYYRHPDIGRWQLAIEDHRLVSHTFAPEEEDKSLEEQLENAALPFPQRRIREEVRSLDLATLFPKDTLPGVTDLHLTYQLHQFPTYTHKALAAAFLLIAAVTYNIASIQKWGTQLQSAKIHLKEIKAKVETPQYHLLKNHIEAQGAPS